MIIQTLLTQEEIVKQIVINVMWWCVRIYLVGWSFIIEF